MSPVVIVLIMIVIFVVAMLVQSAVRKVNVASIPPGTIAMFDGLHLTRTELIDGAGDLAHRYPVVGLSAHVEDSGTLQKRITATRLVTIGVFALAAQKKNDGREVFLTIQGDHAAILRAVQLKDNPTAAGQARAFALQLNQLANSAAVATEPTIGTQTVDVVLHSAGTRTIQVIKILREIRPDLSLLDARNLAERVPSAIGVRVDEAWAASATARLRQAGALVDATPSAVS